MAENISYRLLYPFVRGILYATNLQDVRETEAGSMQMAQEHYRNMNPIWSFFSHMSKEDGPHALEFLAREFPNRRGNIVMPIAKHTYDKLKPVLPLAEIAYGVIWKPVTTLRTIADGKGSSTIEGVRDYLKDAMEATQSGGIVTAALQAGGGLPAYGEPTTVFSTLARMKELAEKGNGKHVNVGIQFLGIIPKHSLNTGKDAHGGQMLRRMRINVGRFTRLDDILRKLGDEPKTLDNWAYEQMKALLPTWYTKKA